MSNMDVPAESNGGRTGTPVDPELAALPERVRVHALARLIGKSSRQVLDALSGLGEPARSAHSSVPKPIALQVAQELGDREPDATGHTEATGATESAGSTPFSDVAEQAEPPQRPAALTPVFTAPTAVFRPAQPSSGSGSESTDDGQQAGAAVNDDSAGPDDGADDEGSRRRRRRGRRGRGRGKGGQNGESADSGESDEASGAGSEEGHGKTEKQNKQSKQGKQAKGHKRDEENTPDAESIGAEPDAPDADTGDEDTEGGSRRRRRRRRRKGTSDEDTSGEVDPPNTVTHVREARDKQDSSRDEVRSVRGSTRLEAKRQRRRDGRDAGRRRVPILSEAEFLARRESVDRKMVVREHGDQVQIAVLEDDVLVEHFVTTAGSGSLVGNVYLGRVQNVLPSMEAAFVDIGRSRNAVLYAGEVDWDSAGLEGKARKIEQALSTGDSVLVQVTKDPVGHKGARLTTQISLPGRFLVYVPGGGATGISRKLPDTERKRLKDILKGIVPADAGVIVRTASEGIAEEELDRDVRRLQAQWDVINDKAKQKSTKAPQLLYGEPDLLVKVVRDMFTEDFSALVVEGSNAWETIDAYVQHVAPDLAERLKRHTPNTDVFAEYRIDEQITKALDRKVWLPSGGYLVIDRTEAMTVIDVNTGKFTGSGGNLEETVTRNNLEAAEEIVRQLRLRDIGGIIVIDFIDMVLESNRDLVLRRLTECLGRDRTRHQVAEVTSLGLVQMTRKRVGTGLLEAFSTPCENCRGRGVVVSTEPVAVGATSGSATGGSGSGTAGGNGGQHGSRKNRQRGQGGDTDNGRSTGQADEDTRKAVERIAAATAAASAVTPTVTAEVDQNGSMPSERSQAVAQPSVEPADIEPVGPDYSSAAAVREPTEDGEQFYQASDTQLSPTGDEYEVPESPGQVSTRHRRRTASRPAGPPENTPV